jgi:hypothetical protein
VGENFVGKKKRKKEKKKKHLWQEKGMWAGR